jgi:PPOX class probable FMN-dependent enzyme
MSVTATAAAKHAISTEAELRAIYGEPLAIAVASKSDRLDELCRQFIGLSPFICISSSDARGRQDVSPRGDAPGFVRVLDDRTIAIPDRPGNNKLETLSNILANPQVAILFMIPGTDETLRINGAARIVRDADLLAAAAVKGKLPRAMVLVSIAEVYPHCGKSFRRARLWDAAARPVKGSVPSLAALALALSGLRDHSVEEVDAEVQKSYVEGLY